MSFGKPQVFDFLASNARVELGDQAPRPLHYVMNTANTRPRDADFYAMQEIYKEEWATGSQYTINDLATFVRNPKNNASLLTVSEERSKKMVAFVVCYVAEQMRRLMIEYYAVQKGHGAALHPLANYLGGAGSLAGYDSIDSRYEFHIHDSRKPRNTASVSAQQGYVSSEMHTQQGLDRFSLRGRDDFTIARDYTRDGHMPILDSGLYEDSFEYPALSEVGVQRWQELIAVLDERGKIRGYALKRKLPHSYILEVPAFAVDPLYACATSKLAEELCKDATALRCNYINFRRRKRIGEIQKNEFDEIRRLLVALDSGYVQNPRAFDDGEVHNKLRLQTTSSTLSARIKKLLLSALDLNSEGQETTRWTKIRAINHLSVAVEQINKAASFAGMNIHIPDGNQVSPPSHDYRRFTSAKRAAREVPRPHQALFTEDATDQRYWSFGAGESNGSMGIMRFDPNGNQKFSIDAVVPCDRDLFSPRERFTGAAFAHSVLDYLENETGYLAGHPGIGQSPFTV